MSLGEVAEFWCRHDTADFIGWKVNGSLISQANPPPDITLEFISGGSKLTIIGRLEYDGTEVVGVAIFYSSSPPDETNPPAILRGTYVQYRQGLYSRVMLYIYYSYATVSMNTTITEDNTMSGKY